MDLLVETEGPADWSSKTRKFYRAHPQIPSERDIVVTKFHVVVLDLGRPIVPKAPFNAGANRPAPARTLPAERFEQVSAVVNAAYAEALSVEGPAPNILHGSGSGQPIGGSRPGTTTSHVPQGP